MGLHALDMISRNKNNRNWSEEQSRRRAALRKVYTDAVFHDSKIKTRELSEQELIEIKKRIREQIKKERRRRVIISAFVMVAVTCLVVFLFILWNNQNFHR